MKIVLSLTLFTSLLMAESITLDAIAVDETALPSGSYVLSQQEAKESNSVSIQDRLQRNVSFSVSNDIIGESALSFRGLNYKATEYIEDGIPLYRSVNGVVDTKRITTASDLYVNDGSSASSFGVSPMGGEVSLVSARPEVLIESMLSTTISTNDEYYHGYVGTKLGRVYLQADADVYHRSAYKLSDDYEPTLVQSKGNRVNSDKKQKSVSFKSGVYLGEHTHLAAKVSLSRAEYGLAPNVHTDLVAPRWDAFSRIDNKDLNSFYLYADYDAEMVNLSARAYYDDYKDVFTIFDDLSYQQFGPVVTYDDNRLGAVVKAEVQEEISTTSIVLVSEKNEHRRLGGGFVTANYQANMMKGSLLQAFHLGNFWRLDGALSYTFMKIIEGSDASATEPIDDKKALDALIKLSYETQQSTLYGSFAKKSRMPTMNEMFTFFPWTTANPGLKPEQSLQGSMGYQQLISEESLVDLSLYYYDIEDLIVYQSSNDSYINRESAINYGAEIRTESSYLQRQLWRFSYAYTYTKDSAGKQLELVPQHQVKIEDTIALAKEWEGYVEYRYLGSRYSSNSATYSDEQKKLSSYHLVDLQLNYTPLEQFTGRVGIKNLLDDAYEWRYGFPAEGRSFYASLEWEL